MRRVANWSSRFASVFTAFLVSVLTLVVWESGAFDIGARAQLVSCRASYSGQRFDRTELYLGQSRPDGSVVGDAEFQSFVDSEITPRFPDGFTIVAGRGQYRDSVSGIILREGARVLVMLHPADDARSDQHIEAIRACYKSAFQQQSVLRVDGASCASF